MKTITKLLVLALLLCIPTSIFADEYDTDVVDEIEPRYAVVNVDKTLTGSFISTNGHSITYSTRVTGTINRDVNNNVVSYNLSATPVSLSILACGTYPSITNSAVSFSKSGQSVRAFLVIKVDGVNYSRSHLLP